MISNAILVGVYYYLGRKNFGLTILAAAFLKFLFLYELSNLWLPIVLTSMLGWVQFYTAVLGGIMAYLVLKFITPD